MKENRYSRQELFAPIGSAGQKLLKSKHILIVGAGALGSSSAEMLVRSGVGTVTIVDRDYVEISNLGRQQLYTENDVQERLPKAIAAEKRLQAINSDVEVQGIVMDASASELETLIMKVDVVIDGTDNFETRLIINDVSQKHGVPWIFGACVGSYGMSYTFIPRKTPCLSCMLENIPMQGMTCDTIGVISPVVNMVATYQVTEAMKLLVGDEKSLRNSLITFDLWSNQRMEMKMEKAKKIDCLSCNNEAMFPYLQKENLSQGAVLCGRETVQIRPANNERKIDLKEVEKWLKESERDVTRNPYLLSTELESQRIVLFEDGRMLIHGTKDIAFARKIYQSVLG